MKPLKKSWLVIIAILILIALILSLTRTTCEPIPPEPEPGPHDSLVYSRQPRLAEKYENWHRWYDAGAPDRFTEADLVIDDLHGDITTIYDCTNIDTICAAHDNRVSPDGKKIMFTVAVGAGLYPVRMWDSQESTPPVEFFATNYSLWIYDDELKAATKLEDNARQGEWLSNSDIVFLSNRAGTYAPQAVGGVVPNYNVKALQLYRAQIDAGRLTNIVNLTPSAPFVLNPMVMHNGKVCYSEWDGFGLRAQGHTPANFWWPRCMNADGTDDLVVLNAHGTVCLKARDYLKGIVDPARSGEGCFSMKVARPVRETNTGSLTTAIYYRSNHKQLGIIGSFEVPTGYEGFSVASAQQLVETQYTSTLLGSARYLPPYLTLTPYANDQDLSHVGTRFDLEGRAMGKAGWPSPPIKGRGILLFTHARGSCYEGTTQMYNTVEAMGGQPTCKTEIRESYVLRITNPFDEAQSKVIACASNEFNCFDANWFVPYNRLPFGMDAPAYKPYTLPAMTAPDKTELHIVNARAAELYKLSGANYRPEDDCTYQGCGSPNYSNLVTAIQIDKITQWKAIPTRMGWETLETIGKFPIQNEDGSLKISLPCGINYRTSGIQANGEIIALDQTAHSAKCGEIVTCYGCHDGHSYERVQELGASAVDLFKKTTAAGQ